MKFLVLFFVLLLSACSTPKEATEKVSFMTFNIRYGTAKDGENHWQKRKGLVFDVIRKYSPDILGLQEAWDFQIAEIIKALPEYDYIGVSREGADQTKGEYSCILYKKSKYVVSDVETFWLSDTPSKPSCSWGNKLFRICTKALFTDRESKKTFYAYNTHFDHRSQNSKVESAYFIIEKMASRNHQAPFVFMGDLNSPPKSKQIKYLQENSHLPLEDTHFKLHPDDRKIGTFSGFKFNQFKNKIDYIFVEKDSTEVLKSETVRYSVDRRYPSDHFPVYTELIFK